jgi:hypothetical protein
MEQLRLPEPADAVICTLDALNYLTRPEKAVQQTIRGGCSRRCGPAALFLFDVNTPYQAAPDGRPALDWTRSPTDLLRLAARSFRRRRRCAPIGCTCSPCRTDGAWTRSWEEHRERAWEEAELRSNGLRRRGFVRVRVTGDLTNRLPRPEEDRWIIRAVRPGRA